MWHRCGRRAPAGPSFATSVGYPGWSRQGPPGPAAETTAVVAVAAAAVDVVRERLVVGR